MCRYRHDCDPDVPLPAPNRSKKRYRQSRRREQVQEAYIQEAYVQDKEQDDERYHRHRCTFDDRHGEVREGFPLADGVKFVRPPLHLKGVCARN